MPCFTEFAAGKVKSMSLSLDEARLGWPTFVHSLDTRSGTKVKERLTVAVSRTLPHLLFDFQLFGGSLTCSDRKHRLKLRFSSYYHSEKKK